MNKYDKLFESENIYYIKMTESLKKEYVNMYYDLEIQKLLFAKIFTKEQIENWINKQLSDDNAHIFSMIEKETDDYIGDIQVMDKGNNIGEIFISITKDKQDRHYGTEAIKEMLKYSKEVLGLEELELYVKKTNERAVHCYEKIGFVINGDGITDEDFHMNKTL